MLEYLVITSREERFSFSAYKPIELEDPPETLHTPWGIWIHNRDALHRIEQRYDTEHMLRAARAAEDILHYANYVPKIGNDEDEIKPSEINFDYNYMHKELFMVRVQNWMRKKMLWM